jgi:imidazolonepropionase-like amidohydrolase
MTTNQQTLFINATLIDGNGGEPVHNAAVRVVGNTIQHVGRTEDFESTSRPFDGSVSEYRVVDLKGRTLMPGLVEGHVHLAWQDANGLPDIDYKPIEETIIGCVKNVELLLRCGYTAALSTGTKARSDIAIKGAIESGLIPGPRFLANGPEISASSGLTDWHPSNLKLGLEGAGIVADGPDQVRKAARKLIKEGVNTIKLNLSGEGLSPTCTADHTTYTYEEVRAAVEEAHQRGVRVAAHARSAESVKIALRAEVDIIFHATLIDEEAFEMMVSHKDRFFFGPAINWLVATVEKGPLPPAVLDQTGYVSELKLAAAGAKRLYDAGIRMVPGGDFGFAWCRHGEYAKDLENFVKVIGLTPMQALVCATKTGGEYMLMGDKIGTIEEGKLADLIVVDGDPLADITILQDRSRLALVMKDGEVMVNQFGLPQRLAPEPVSSPVAELVTA